MSMLPAIIVAVAAKYGLTFARDKGWYPSNFYLGKAIRELKEDNLEKAIQNWKIAFEKNSDKLEILAVREIIQSEMDLRIRVMEGHVRFLEDKKEDLKRKKLWLGVKRMIPWYFIGEDFVTMKKSILNAMNEIKGEISQFMEGITILETLKKSLYKEFHHEKSQG